VSQTGASPALLAALRERGDTLPARRVERLWLFGPRPIGAAESSLAVLSLFDDNDAPQRRRIFTLHCTATIERGRLRWSAELVEQGSVPAERVERMIGGVLARLKDERDVPRSEPIDGDPARWAAVVGIGEHAP
jgi:hypothetical protein